MELVLEDLFSISVMGVLILIIMEDTHGAS